MFEPTTEVIRKGKAGKPNKFGKLVKVQEAENQIVTDYEVYEKRPADRELLIAAVEEPGATPGTQASAGGGRGGVFFGGQRAGLGEDGRAAGFDPQLRDARSGAARQTEATLVQGVARSGAREWRAASASSNVGMALNRSRYPGLDGMRRWVGLGVIADNLINIGASLEAEGDNVRESRGRRAAGEIETDNALGPLLRLRTPGSSIPIRLFAPQR